MRPNARTSFRTEEKALALKNALRYFPVRHHAVLAKEFAEELRRYGRIYMYRLRPDYEMHARPIGEYPCPLPAGGGHHADDSEQPRPGGWPSIPTS